MSQRSNPRGHLDVRQRGGGDLIAARHEVTSFVRFKADETAKTVGFSYVGVPDAPSEYQQLRGAYADAWATKTPLPVSNEHCVSMSTRAGPRVTA